MEHNIKDIELIDDYLNKTLTEKETINFEQRLQTDSNFKQAFETHTAILEGIKRQQTKSEIISGKQIHIRHKWLRYFGFTIFTLALIATVIILFNVNTSIDSKNNINPPELERIIPPTDTITPLKPTSTKSEIIEHTIALTDTVDIQKTAITKPEVKQKIADTIKIPKKPVQNISFNSEKDTTLVFKEGTKLTIKRGSFRDQNNKVISGRIELEVTEYYTLSDILLANLATQSNGKLLETGGMLNIKAYQNNTPLHLAPNSTIEILFPTKSKKDGMQLFTGTWNNENINWELQNNSITEVVDNIEVFVQEEDLDVEVPFSIIEIPPAYPGCEHLKSAESKKCTNEAISKFVMANFNTEIAENLGLRGKQRINTIFKINQEGIPVSITSRASDPELENETNRVIALLPKMKPGKQRGKTVIVPYSLPIVFQVGGNSQQTDRIVGTSRRDILKRDSIVNKKFEDNLIETPADVEAYEVNGYILRTSKLGWINCDRFIRRTNIPFKLKIKNAGDDIRVNMVFKSFKSIMPSHKTGDTFDFKNVPKNENVVLIAIKKDQGKLYLGTVKTKIEENPNITFDFKEVNLETLKAELDKLNNTF
ncbi:hypothetical protein [Formosa sp. PL04]|uniref:hypothetical protein n=1 Tax=Formosa sp. PL04 TaxID=3081755 RepID=UPI002981CA60|nr:hypothetical protein [Formosa sp. PL04]MDW5288038.1 hypothetical protein [Formosa sp. PL04]